MCFVLGNVINKACVVSASQDLVSYGGIRISQMQAKCIMISVITFE